MWEFHQLHSYFTTKFEGASHLYKTTLTSHTNCKFEGFPKPPSGLTVCLKYSQNSAKAVMLIVKVYYRGRLQIKTSQEKCVRLSLKPQESTTELSLSSPHGVWTCYITSTEMWPYAWSVANPGSSSEPLVSRIFNGTWSYMAHVVDHKSPAWMSVLGWYP